ncbi:hypothetical protein ES703_03589 [subsurface metagenome]|nr:hypothetical protein [bacterium]
MLNISLLALALCGGVLVEPFQVADHQPGHNQKYVCAAMASDGHFAVAWIDGIASGDPDPDDLEPELFIRFFDRDGNPMTEAYKITKLADTTWIRYPCLEMDTAGNTILLWADTPIWREDEPWYALYAWYVRFQRFAPDGSPVGSAHTLVARAFLGKSTYKLSSIDLSLNNNEEFVVTWCEIEPGPPTYKNYVWVERFDMEGDPKNRPFLACDEECVFFYYPRVALSDAGDVAVTWRDQPTPFYSGTVCLRFQVFDAADEPILSWRSRGHLLDYEEHDDWEPQLFWLDNDRFVVFWQRLLELNVGEYVMGWLARVFGHRGLARYPIRLVMIDPHEVGGGWEKMFSVALSSDERFAETHLRWSKLHAEPNCYWFRPGGIIGEIRDNEPWRQTNLFEYTESFGKDTTFKAVFIPAVGVCDDRIVWVYPRSTPDSLCEAWALISDWDMGVGVVERPIVEKPPDWEVITSIGSQIVLRYQDRPDGFRASIFDASGRKVDEVHATESSGMITWGRCYGSGVYFIKPVVKSEETRKVVLTK